MGWLGVDWDAVAAIGQAVGALGVIVSLIYVGLQVRDDARARRAQTVHQQSNAFTTALHTLASSPDLAEIIVRGRQNLSSLSDIDMLRFNAGLSGNLRVWEDSYLQFREGNLSAQVWHGMEGPLAFIFSFPGTQAFWRISAANHSPEFRALIESKIAQSQASGTTSAAASPAAAATPPAAAAGAAAAHSGG